VLQSGRLADSLVAILPTFLVLVLSLSFHEAAHAWSADRLGDPTARLLGRLTLNPLKHIDWIGTVLFPLLAMIYGLPLIGWAKPVPVVWANLRAPRRDFAVVALAGPVSNLILAAAGFVVLWAAFTALPIPLIRALITFVSLNCLLAAFNMIPIPPLDGGNVLAGLVPESVARLIDMLRPYGFVLVYLLLFLTPVFWNIARHFSADAVLGWLL
jgi:Zn-dependent protease